MDGGAGSEMDADGAVQQACKCSRCGESMQSHSSLEIHIASDHLSFMPLKCVYCQYVRLPTIYALQQHYSSLHKDKDVQVNYTLNDEFVTKWRQLRELMTESLGHQIRSDDISNVMAPTCDGLDSFVSDTSNERNRGGRFNSDAIPVDLVTNSTQQEQLQKKIRRSLPAKALSDDSVSASEKPVVEMLNCARCNAPLKKFIPALHSHVRKHFREDTGMVASAGGEHESTIRLYLEDCFPNQLSAAKTGGTVKWMATSTFNVKKRTSIFNVKKSCGVCAQSISDHPPAMRMHARSHALSGTWVADQGEGGNEQESMKRLLQRCFPNTVAETLPQPPMRMSESPEVVEIDSDDMPASRQITKRQHTDSIDEGRTPAKQRPSDTNMISDNDFNSTTDSTQHLSSMISDIYSISCGKCGVKQANHDMARHHCWQHLNVNVFECRYCSFTSKRASNVCMGGMKRHVATRHREQEPPGFTDNRARYLDRFTSMLQECFPGLARQEPIVPEQNTDGNVAPDAVGDPRTCRLCGKITVSQYSRNYHVWQHHVRRKVLACPQCTYYRRTPFHGREMKQHIQSEHGLDPEVMVNNRKKYKKLFQQSLATCFPSAETRNPSHSSGSEHIVVAAGAVDGGESVCRVCGEVVSAEERQVHIIAQHTSVDDDYADMQEMWHHCFSRQPSKSSSNPHSSAAAIETAVETDGELLRAIKAEPPHEEK